MSSDGFTKMETMEVDTERAESSMEPSTMCPFSYPLGCVFAGEYLGLMWNPDYNTLRAVFQVNDRICSEEFISYFENMRELIAEQEKARDVKVRVFGTNSSGIILTKSSIINRVFPILY